MYPLSIGEYSTVKLPRGSFSLVDVKARTVSRWPLTSVGRNALDMYPTHETFKILCEEVKGDASVKEHEKVNGKPKSQFYSAVTARAQVLAYEWAAAFLGPDDSVLKTYLYSTPTETRKLGAMTLLRSFHMVEELHPT